MSSLAEEVKSENKASVGLLNSICVLEELPLITKSALFHLLCFLSCLFLGPLGFYWCFLFASDVVQ